MFGADRLASPPHLELSHEALDRADVSEAALCKSDAHSLHLLDAGREGAEPAHGLHHVVCVRDGVPRRGHVEEHSVSKAADLVYVPVLACARIILSGCQAPRGISSTLPVLACSEAPKSTV